jgi:hypothetical protein
LSGSISNRKCCRHYKIDEIDPNEAYGLGEIESALEVKPDIASPLAEV